MSPSRHDAAEPVWPSVSSCCAGCGSEVKLPDNVVWRLVTSQAASLLEIALDGPTIDLSANLAALPQLRSLTRVSLDEQTLCLYQFSVLSLPSTPSLACILKS